MFGGDICLRMYSEEIGVRLFTNAVLAGACYLAKDRGGGCVSIVLGVSAIQNGASPS